MENYNLISAKIVADSLNQFGERITTMKLIFPRIILAEFNTHRMFNRNSASSRAIPFKKMVKEVMERPFVPIAWQKDHKGMQGNDYFQSETGENVHKLVEGWLDARNSAVQIATGLNNSNVTKQLCNRLLEPFLYHTVLLTATEFTNFMNLRCPSYEWEYEEGVIKAKSKEEFLEMFIKRYPTNGERELHDMELVDEHLNPNNSIDWFNLNKGQADIHIMDLAEKMYDAYNESEPKQLKEGEWHIPFGDTFNTLKQEDDLEDLLNDINYIPKNILFNIDFLTQAKLAIATARCARISYETLGDNPEINYEKDIKLHDDLLAMKHFSPFEHCCVVPSEQEYNEARKGKEIGWFYNLKGFKSYRFSLDNPS